MIVKRMKFFAASPTSPGSDFEKGNMKSESSNTTAPMGGESSGLKIPPPPDITSKPSTTIPTGSLMMNGRAMGMAERKLTGTKAFSYQPTLGNSYVNSIQVVDDKVLSPIEDLSDKVAKDDRLKKPTYKIRTAIKGYIDGIRLLKKDYVSKKKASRQQRGSRKGKK